MYAVVNIMDSLKKRSLHYPRISRQGQKEGRFGDLCRFQQLRSYRNEIETWIWEEIPFFLRIVPRGLSVSEGP